MKRKLETAIDFGLAALLMVAALVFFIFEIRDPIAAQMRAPFSVVLIVGGACMLWNAITARRLRLLEDKVQRIEKVDVRGHS